MPLSRNVLERQVELAKSELSEWIAQLAKDGVDKAEYRKNAKWRTLNAKHNQIQRRLTSLAKVEAIDAEVANRKTAAAAEPEEAVKPAPAAKPAGKKAKA
jgi:hypothetical protein